MIKTLYLRNFRNYKEAHITFSPKANMIWGDNAQGKTNLLEALHLFLTGRSFRTPHLAELIRFGSDAFYLEILFEKNGIEQTLKFSFNGTERNIVHNATPLPSLSALLGILNGVLLSPEDRALIKGGPSIRRQFLDLLLSQAKPLYLFHLSRYLRAMKQRNLLLKQRSLPTLPIWEEQMAAAAAFLTQMRVQTVLELTPLTQNETLGSDQIELAYRSQALASVGPHLENLRLFFLKQFAKHRSRECDLGISLSGPHRDDLLITLQNKEARQFASEGQQRACVASLKLAQWKWLQTFADQMPILSIDDIGISFDQAKENALYKRMEKLGQVFITSARKPTQELEGHLIHIESGSVLFAADL
jgi:DNA replication and repair protein RecF